MDLEQGKGKRLLQQCIDDAKAVGMDGGGAVTVTGEKKRPFMSDPKFLKKQGFEVVDQAAPFFRLLALRLTDAPVPQFLDNAVRAAHRMTQGSPPIIQTAAPLPSYIPTTGCATTPGKRASR